MSGGHTPGPWTCDTQPVTARGHAFVYGPSPGSGPLPVLARVNRLADARLIAAAPAMYEALERIVGSEPRVNRDGRYDASAVEDLQRIARLALKAAVGLDLTAARNALALCTTPSTHNEPAKEGRR
jgi:hypothetical protein